MIDYVSLLKVCPEKSVIVTKKNHNHNYTFAGYSTNSLSSVSVGKSTLEPHTHFRQPGE